MLTRRRLQRGVFRSLVDLQAAINRHLGEPNRKTQTLRLDRRPPTASLKRLIAGIKRSHQTNRRFLLDLISSKPQRSSPSPSDGHLPKGQRSGHACRGTDINLRAGVCVGSGAVTVLKERFLAG
jgi:hypothetical protein